jgi:hypothetical protein
LPWARERIAPVIIDNLGTRSEKGFVAPTYAVEKGLKNK